VSGASFDAGHAIEDRRGAGRRPAAAAERRRIPARGFAALDMHTQSCSTH
jgi:hypothetical protein